MQEILIFITFSGYARCSSDCEARKAEGWKRQIEKYIFAKQEKVGATRVCVGVRKRKKKNFLSATEGCRINIFVEAPFVLFSSELSPSSCYS